MSDLKLKKVYISRKLLTLQLPLSEAKNFMNNPYTLSVILFGLVRFYGMSSIVGYLMPNPVYLYILDIYD